MSNNWGLHISIPGDFEHAFLYKGKLLAINADAEIWSTSIEDLLDLSFPQAHPFDPAGILAREMMHGKSFWEIRHYLSNPELLSLVEEPRRIDNASWLRSSIDNSELRRHQILDVTVYFDRLYLSTTGGLFHIDVQALTSDSAPPATIHAYRRSDAYTFSSTVKYACVVASCGDDGLFAWMDDFGTLGLSDTELHNDRTHSIRASWLRQGLINYPESNRADFLPATVNKVHTSTAGEDSEEVSIITDIGGLEATRGPDLLEHQNHYSPAIQLMYNADSKFAFVDNAGALRFEDRYFSQSTFGGTVYNEPERQSTYIGDPYAAFAILPPYDTALQRPNYDDIRIGVNASTGVYLADSCGIRRISDMSAVTCKSFPTSRSYRGTILIVDDDEVMIRAPRPLHINRQRPVTDRCLPYA